MAESAPLQGRLEKPLSKAGKVKLKIPRTVQNIGDGRAMGSLPRNALGVEQCQPVEEGV